MIINESLVRLYLLDVCYWIGSENSRRITVEEYNQILSRMSKDMPAKELSTALSILKEYLLSNNLASEKEPVFSTMFRPDRPKARINTRALSYDSAINKLDTIFLYQLEKLSELKIEEVRALIIYSSMRYGLLLNKDYLPELVKKLHDPLSYLNGKLWYEFSIPGTTNVQIWNPDSLTLSILKYWYECRFNSEEIYEDVDIYKSLNNLFKYVGFTLRSRKITSITKLIEALSTLASINIPSYLIDFCTGVTDCRSVNRSSYLRLISGLSPLVDFDKVSRKEISNLIEKTDNQFEKYDELFLNKMKSYLELDEIIEIESLIRDFLDEYRMNISFSSYYLGKWIKQRLTGKNYWLNKLSISTIRKRFKSISRDVISEFDSLNPMELEVNELESIYDEILDKKERSDNFIRTLEDYHFYLVEHEGVEKVYSGRRWLKDQGYQQVDANVVTFSESKEIESYYWNSIRNKSLDENERQLMSLRLIIYSFGFYTGVRRREIIGARLGDLSTIGRQVLRIREHDDRTLKSGNAPRQLPIWIYFSDELLNLINRYVLYRKEHGAKDGDYLFDLSGENQSSQIKDRKVFNHIHWVMQYFTGDNTARFHHLRHSCGTWMLWKLSLPYLKDKTLGLNNMPQFSDKELLKFQKNLLSNNSLEYPSQNIVPEIVRMLGHGNGGMSLGHYVHTPQLILDGYRDRLLPEKSSSLLARLAGISIRQVQKIANGSGSSLNANLIRPIVTKKLSKFSYKPDLSTWIYPKEKSLGNYRREISGTRLPEFDLWEGLLVYSNGERDIDYICRKNDLKKPTFLKALSRVNELFGHDGFLKMHPFPNARKEIKTAEIMLKNYQDLSDAKRRVVNRAIDYYANNFDLSIKGIPFTKKEELKEFIKIFGILGLHKSVEDTEMPGYRLTLRSNKPLESVDRNRQWEFWKRTSYWYNYQLANKFDESIDTERGLIALDYLSEKPKERSSNSIRLSDRGFSFAIQILAVITADS